MAETTTTASGDTFIRLKTGSRYRNTRIFLDTSSKIVYFGTWRPPSIIEKRPCTPHRVVADERYRPDLIASRVYGNPNLFWAIAYRNGILLPMKDIAVGQVLMCPHIDDISAALNTSYSQNPGTT